MAIKAIKGLSKEAQTFVVCILLHMSLPLIPVMLESLLTQASVTNASITIAVALYAFGLGNGSRSSAFYALCLVIGISLTIVFGLIHAAPSTFPQVRWWCYGLTVLIFVVHLAERFNRHVVNAQPYFEFLP